MVLDIMDSPNGARRAPLRPIHSRRRRRRNADQGRSQRGGAGGHCPPPTPTWRIFKIFIIAGLNRDEY